VGFQLSLGSNGYATELILAQFEQMKSYLSISLMDLPQNSAQVNFFRSRKLPRRQFRLHRLSVMLVREK